jgi:hypothetical protein
MFNRIFVTILALWSFNIVATELTITTPDTKITHHINIEEMKTLFPAQEWDIKLPWLHDSAHFTGFKLTDLLKHFNVSQAQRVSFCALNGYTVTVSMDNINQYQPIIAYYMNNKEMPIRSKGPFWFLYNLDIFPELNNNQYLAHMIWQLKEIQITSYD